jgi:lysophospholipase L1-like esterase
MKNNLNFSREKSLYGFILLCLIGLLVVLYKGFYTKEGFDNDSENTIVLMGDSILKNNVYVAKDKSVEDILKQQYKGKLINLAKDNSTVSDIYGQINQLNPDLNNRNTTIFVSIGGNDILNKYVYVTQDVDIDDFNKLYEIYLDYKDALKKLREKMPKAKLILMNLYYPKSLKYAKYRELIKKWNDLLFEYADDPINGVKDVLDLSLIMTDINDFSLCIEPSEKGSIKISREILILSKE